ncbi:MAG: hypothetical protein GX552_11100 [Chloroflexi bacterium]|nr:hypothetical protein [Chloroflexota bacterium]
MQKDAMPSTTSANGGPTRRVSLPARVLSALGLGALSGLIVGLLFSMLVVDSLIAISVWQRFLPADGASSHTFWAMTGAALGLIIVGAGGLFTISTSAADHIE